MEMLRAASSLTSFHLPDLRERPHSAFEHSLPFRPRRIQTTESQRRRFDERIAQIRRERALAASGSTSGGVMLSTVQLQMAEGSVAPSLHDSLQHSIHDGQLDDGNNRSSNSPRIRPPQLAVDSSYTSSSTSDSCQV